MNPNQNVLTLQHSQSRSDISRTYSSAVSSPIFPSKEQAIVFSALENTRLQDYLIPLGSIIQPKNIIFSSRLSNNQICIYLSNKQLVETFMNDYGQIEVNGMVVSARN